MSLSYGDLEKLFDEVLGPRDSNNTAAKHVVPECFPVPVLTDALFHIDQVLADAGRLGSVTLNGATAHMPYGNEEAVIDTTLAQYSVLKEPLQSALPPVKIG
jgi:hypothetical protein